MKPAKGDDLPGARNVINEFLSSSAPLPLRSNEELGCPYVKLLPQTYRVISFPRGGTWGQTVFGWPAGGAGHRVLEDVKGQQAKGPRRVVLLQCFSS